MTAETIDDIRIQQAAWSEGWRKTPLWLRLLGAPKQHYADRGRCYRMAWGELSLGPCSIGVAVGGYETAHLHIALGLFQAFIRLPFLDEAICGGPNSIESPHYGFAVHLTCIHLNWGRHCRIVEAPWQRRFLFREFLAVDGRWLPADQRARDYRPGEGVEPLATAAPYHYLLDDGEVQSVTATVTRGRSWTVWRWFGESTSPQALGRVDRPRRAWLSDYLRGIQKRLSRPQDVIDVAFSGEIGSRAGSWKGGCVGCSYEMRPGERPQDTLRRMQRERRFH
jgi:hypothetical protein